MDEIDFTVLAAKSVFTDLIDKCPPAETCHDAFDRTAKATIKMANSTGGFGAVLPKNQSRESKMDWSSVVVGGGDGSPSSAADLSRGRRSTFLHQAPFRRDFSGGSDTLSSPSLSTSGDLAGRSPTLTHSKTIESDPYAMVTSQQPGQGRSPPDMAGLDATMMASPGLLRPQQQTAADAGTPSTFLGQQGPPRS